MSMSVVKRSLYLFEDDLEAPSGSTKKATNHNLKMSTNRRGMKKEMKKVRQKKEQKAMTKKIRTIEDDKHWYEEKDNTDGNLSFIKKLSALESTKPEAIKKIVTHSRGKLSKDNRDSSEKVEKDFTIFSETDFDRFEKEFEVDFWKK